jgi:peptide/nickel transport system ATP-binding protein
MQRGKIVEIGETQQIVGRPQHAYTRTLVEATPEIGFGSP